MFTASGSHRFFLVHADESCLGNQYDGLNPGGASALVETGIAGSIERRDLYLCSPKTTNNRMALEGAIEVLRQLSHNDDPIHNIFFSDSQYLVKGITEWLPGWKARGWRRKGGAILNVDSWRELDRLAAIVPTSFAWVRGHDGHAKNEYADYLAVTAATQQIQSDGLVPSGLCGWLDRQHQSGKLLDFDPDRHFDDVIRQYANRS